MFGYKPKTTGLATVNVDIYQQVPSKVEGTTIVPDFVIQDAVDFSVTNSMDETITSIAQVSSAEPEYFLLKKTRKAISATINTTTFNFGEPEKFSTRNITANKIIGILDIKDSDGNEYFEINEKGRKLKRWKLDDYREDRLAEKEVTK